MWGVGVCVWGRFFWGGDTHEGNLSNLLFPHSIPGITQQIKNVKKSYYVPILGCQLEICNMDFVMIYSGALIRS